MSVLTEIEADAKALLAKIEGNSAVQTVETDVKQAASATVSYIKNNGLQDLYQLALDALPALFGQPWATVLAKVESDAVTLGKTLEAGASTIIASQVQADVVAAGKLLPTAVTAPANTPAS